MSILSNTVRSQIRANYLEEMAIVADYQVPFRYFFGMDYDQETVRNFEPDVLGDSRTEVTIGGTRFDLIPVPGGETVDGMFISMPDNGVLFVGDFIMPYLVFADFLLFCELVKLSIGRAVQQPDELDKSEEALHAQLINSMPC